MHAAPIRAPAVAAGNAAVKRRRKRRIPHRVPCRLRIFGPLAAQPLLGETVDISPTGLALQLGADVAAGTRVEVLLPHLDGEPACLYGTVVRRRRVLTGTYEIGIRLDHGRRVAGGGART